MRAILDTSVLIGTDVGELEGDLAISTVSLAELHYGVLVGRDRAVRGERLRRLTALRAAFDAIPVDDAVATSYGLLASAVAQAGRSPRPRGMDLLIAATAHAHAQRLYTRNAEDLVGLEKELEIVSC
ncbi:type II toxin-antitoxin system VapC family toxin [Actinomycetospora sp. CA-084318]|uniref:type II toxin-antitoxin system VapC family toxin n=1 Tax=Actinomycetospora sp. CA-084318 TaxID=3239892 RepID=UPI003D9910B5